MAVYNATDSVQWYTAKLFLTRNNLLFDEVGVEFANCFLKGKTIQSLVPYFFNKRCRNKCCYKFINVALCQRPRLGKNLCHWVFTTFNHFSGIKG